MQKIARKEWIARKKAFDDLSQEPSLLDSSTTLQRFMQLAENNSRYHWLKRIENALSSVELDTVTALLGMNKNGFVNTTVDTQYHVIMADSTGANEVVDNHIKYYGVLLHYMQDTNQVINTEDSIVLRSLAFKCPSVDGAIIYDARALFSQIFRTTMMFHTMQCDSIVRISGKDERSTDIVQQSYKLYPNPNDGHIYLQQSLKYDEAVEIEIRNIVGGLVLRKQITFTTKFAEVQMQQAIPGIYMMRIREGNGNSWNMKFIVQ